MNSKTSRLLLFLFFLPTVAFAQQPWEGAAFSGKPEAVAAAARTAVGVDSTKTVVLFLDHSVSIDATHRVTETRRLVYRLGTDREGWTTAEALFRPWRQQKPVLRARVITPDGRESELDQQSLSESPARDLGAEFFGDTRVIRGPLPALSPGVVVEMQSIVRDTTPLFDRGISDYFPLGFDAPALRTRIILEAPAEMPLKFATRSLPGVTPERTTARGRTTLTFNIGRIDPPKDVAALVVNGQPLIAYSTAAGWGEIADAYERIVESRIGKSDLSAIVRDTLGSATTRDEKLSRLLSLVQKEIRYSAVMLADAGTVPTAPDETLRLKYGDCKDQAALLVAMARAAGIEAYVALLNVSGGAQDVDSSLPGFGVFDHAIVYVPGETPLWIDPTSGFSRLGQLPLADEDRLALIAKAGTTSLTRTPEYRSEINETSEVFLAEDGPSRVLHASTSLGAQEIAVRSGQSMAAADVIEKSIAEIAKALYGAKTIRSIKYTDPKDFSTPFKLEFEALDATSAETSGVEAVVRIPLSLLVFETAVAVELHDSTSLKGGELLLDGRLTKEWRYRIVPPVGFEKGTLPEKKAERFGPAEYSQDFSIGPDGVVTGVVRFDPGKTKYNPSEVEELRKGLKKFEENDTLTVSFNSIGMSKLLAGDARGAVEEFRRMSALHPTEAIHHIHLFGALREAGIGDAAIKEAQRAVELEPMSALAHYTLGVAFQHDALGREFGSGSDFKKSAAALTRALEIDPENEGARGALAIALEFNDAGTRYGSGADLVAAIEQYKKIVTKAGDRWADNLAFALFYAKRFGEVKTFSKRPELVGAAIAATEGADAGLREIGRLTTDPTRRQAATLQAFTSLTQVRMYPEAAALGMAASRTTAAFQGRNSPDRLASIKRFEDLELPATDPATPAKKLIIALRLKRPESELRALFSKDAQKGWPDVLRRFYDIAKEPFAATPTYFFPEVMLDTDLSAITPSLEGDDASGYKVSFDGALQTREFLVVREDGQYLIANPDWILRSEQELARKALALLDAADVAGARKLLDQAITELRSKNGADNFRYTPAVATFMDSWTKGVSSTRDEIRLAASFLLSHGPAAATVLPTLVDLRKKAVRPDQIKNLDLALVSAHMSAGNIDDSLRLANQLVSRDVASFAYDFVLAWADSIDRPQILKTILQLKLAKKPDDRDVLKLMAELDKQLGNFGNAEAYHRKAMQGFLRGAGPDSEELARLSLFHAEITEADLEEARRYVLSDRSRTVAALLAEFGRTIEARETLLRAMQVDRRSEPDSEDWYVLGRIYEQLGEKDAARAAYQRVQKPSIHPNRADSSYVLAQRRLKAVQ